MLVDVVPAVDGCCDLSDLFDISLSADGLQCFFIGRLDADLQLHQSRAHGGKQIQLVLI